MSALLAEGADLRSYGFSISTSEFIANTYPAFSRYKFRFGDSQVFMWKDIQKSIRPAAKYQDMGLTLEKREYIEWLRNYDFDAYAERYEKKSQQRIGKRKYVVEMIKRIPGLYGSLRALKKIMSGSR